MLIRSTVLRCSVAAAILALAPLPAPAQQVTKTTVPGITNFARLETTIACAGATKPAAVVELRDNCASPALATSSARAAGLEALTMASTALSAGESPRVGEVTATSAQ